MDGQWAGATSPQWRAGQWLADGSLDTLAEINRQCVDALAEMAQRRDPAGNAMAVHAAAWSKLPESGRARLAACPYLLVDAGFDDDLRWRCLDLRMVRDQSLPPAEAAFTGPGATEFVRRVMLFGWYLARANRQLARVALGMAPGCADRLSQLHLHEMDWLASCRPGWLRPRWERSPRVWQHLLQSALDPEGQGMTGASLRGLQLMAAGVLVAATGTPARARRG